MTTSVITIDLNLRTDGGLTLAGLEDVQGDAVVAGDDVVVREVESDLISTGRVVRVDDERRLVYVDVDWDAMRFASPEPLMLEEHLKQVNAASRATSPLGTWSAVTALGVFKASYGWVPPTMTPVRYLTHASVTNAASPRLSGGMPNQESVPA